MEVQRLNGEGMEINSKKWLSYFGWLLLSSLPAVIFIQLAITLSGTINPARWNQQVTFYVVYFLSIHGMVIVSYLDFTERLKFKEFFAYIESKLFDMDQYKSQRILDVFFSHYTGVATIGLFFCIAIFTYKSIHLTSPLLRLALLVSFSLITLLIVALYTLLLLRLAKRFVELKSVALYLAILMSAFFVDTKVLQIMMSSVPRANVIGK